MRINFRESTISEALAILLLILGSLFIGGITSATGEVGFSENGLLVEEWRYDMHWYSWGWFGSSPTIVDLGSDVNTKGNEPDSHLEIVTGSDECCNYYPELGKYACGIWRTFDSEGNVEWAQDTKTDEARSSPAVVDIDGDGEFEIIGGTTSGWYVEAMDRFGEFIWTFPYQSVDYIAGPFVWPSSPAVADIDPNVNGLEIVIGNRHHNSVWAFDGDNSDGIDDGITISSADFPDFPYPLGNEGTDWDVLWIFNTEAPVISTPAIADVDNDGQLEVVIGSTNGNLYILNASDGNPEHTFITNGPIYSSAAIANLDKGRETRAERGLLEIIIGSTDNNVYCFQWDGEEGRTKWTYPTEGPIYSSPAIGDIDGDGEFEIVIGSNDGNIYSLNSSGNEEWDPYPTGEPIYSSPAIANRGENFGFDIYIGSDDGYLYLLDGDTGSKIDRFKVHQSWFGGIHTSPSVADIDGDNKLEIVFYDWGQGSAYNGHTFWVVEDTQSNCDKYSVQWGMFRGNPSRTGTFRIRPFDAVKLAKEVIDADYLWGGKGYDFRKFVDSTTVKERYEYWNPCMPMVVDGECKCYDDNRKKYMEDCGPHWEYYKGKKYCACNGKKDFGKGLDCSGLSFWSYNRAYFYGKTVVRNEYKSRPLYYEGATRHYKDNTSRITKEDLRPGDLLFYNPSGDKKKKMTHEMMYVGPFTYKGKQYDVIHATRHPLINPLIDEIIIANYDIEKEEVVTTTLVNGEEIKQILKVVDYGRVIDYKLDIEFIAHSPIDLIVIDPDEEVITKEMGESLSMAYMIYDIDGNGELDDIVAIPERKIGDYLITVVPEPDALPTDTYSLEVTVAGETIVLAENVPINEIPSEGYGIRSTETEIKIITPKLLKTDAIPKLENAKTGHKIIDKEIDLIVRNIEKSLNDKFWQDASYLEAKYGKKVFHEEHKAVVHMHYKTKLFERMIPALERIIEKKQKRGLDTTKEELKLNAIKKVLPVFKEVTSDLLKADEILAKIAIDEAKNTPVENPKFQKKVDHYIKKAEKELARAEKELEKNKPTRAIKRFEKAWKYAQLAIKFAKFK